MDATQAERLVRKEVASGSAVGQALLFLLESAEINNYRQTKGVTDPLVLSRIAGWGEGLNVFRKRITPVQPAAPSGQPDLGSKEQVA